MIGKGPGRAFERLKASLTPGLWVRVAVLLLIVGSYLVTVIVNDSREHALILQDIERLSSVTTTSAQIHSEVMFAKAIDILWALRADLAKSGDSPEKAQQILEDHFFSAPDLRTTLVLDRDGWIIASSVSTFVGNDAGFHPFFRIHVDIEEDRPFTGNIIVGNVTRAPHLFSSLRLVDAAGKFAGVVAVAYELTYLRDLYRRIVPGPFFTIGLFHAEEGLIVASDSEIRPGELPASSRFPANVPNVGPDDSGPVEVLLDRGSDALMTSRTMDAGPFVVSTMADVNALLSEHRRDHLTKFVLAAIFVCTAIALAIALEIYILDRRRAEADRAALEADLRHAQKMEALGTLAGGLAHDFNNFLSSIIGFGEIARERVADRRPLAAAIDQILVAGRRAEAMVNQILTFSRRTGPTREPVRVGAVLREVVELMQASINPSLTVSLELPREDLWAMGDASQLDQVLMNLCGNAAQAMPDGGLLRIVLDEVDIPEETASQPAGLDPGRYARIRVSDTGTGMPADVRERIFDPFFTTKEIGGGTGLGLSIAHGIVTAHGGAITVDSTPGEGTAAVVYLPLCPPGVRLVESGATRAIDGGGRCVLIVDDEETIVSLLEERLARLGFEPVGHTSASGARRAFERAPGRFTLLITDFAMPGMDGIALARALRRGRPDLPVILMTGYGKGEVSSRARAYGIDVVLAKPLSTEKLANAIARTLHEPRTAA